MPTMTNEESRSRPIGPALLRYALMHASGRKIHQSDLAATGVPINVFREGLLTPHGGPKDPFWYAEDLRRLLHTLEQVPR